MVCAMLWHVVPSVVHKLRTVHEMRDTRYHACALNNFVVTRRDTLENIFATTRHALLHLTRIATRPHAHCHVPHWHTKLRAMA